MSEFKTCSSISRIINIKDTLITKEDAWVKICQEEQEARHGFFYKINFLGSNPNYQLKLIEKK